MCKKNQKKKNLNFSFCCLSLLISRPGILVLINDCDWELEGGINYVAQNGDKIVFISTLHGG